jgi:hypothetical protein
MDHATLASLNGGNFKQNDHLGIKFGSFSSTEAVSIIIFTTTVVL